MSDDVDDAVAQAIALNKRLAATKLVRKEELEADLARLQGERASIQGPAPELDALIEATATELAAAALDLKNTVAEIDTLRKLGKNAQADFARAKVMAALHPDPLMQSTADQTLDHVRKHIGDLDAQDRLERELAGEQPAAPGAAPARPPSKADADAKARALFEQMRQNKAGGGGAAPTGGGGTPAPDDPLSDPPPRPPSKKEL